MKRSCTTPQPGVYPSFGPRVCTILERYNGRFAGWRITGVITGVFFIAILLILRRIMSLISVWCLRFRYGGPLLGTPLATLAMKLDWLRLWLLWLLEHTWLRGILLLIGLCGVLTMRPVWSRRVSSALLRTFGQLKRP